MNRKKCLRKNKTSQEKKRNEKKNFDLISREIAPDPKRNESNRMSWKHSRMIQFDFENSFTLSDMRNLKFFQPKTIEIEKIEIYSENWAQVLRERKKKSST